MERSGFLKPLAALLLAALLLARPQASAAGALAAMARWHGAVAPAVFPFIALLPLLTCDAAIRAYAALLGRATEALFNLPGAAASAMVVGMAAGTPAGAIAARRVAARSGMNRGQLQRLALASMGFSPAFLVGGVGAGLMGSARLGWRLALAQLLTQLSLALLLRRAWADRTEPVPAADPAREEAPVRGAVLAALTICGYMALFGSLGAAARSLVGGPADALLCALDVPTGAALLAALPLAQAAKLAALAAICGFGGVCVILQGLGALRGCGIRAGECFALRALAGLLCAGWATLLGRLGTLAPPAARANPLAAAGLCASALALPVLLMLFRTEAAHPAGVEAPDLLKMRDGRKTEKSNS